MTATPQIIHHCQKLVSDPDYRNDYLRGLKDTHRPIAGTFSNYIPEEVLLAAGLHPVRIIGRYPAAAAHSRRLYNPVCSFVQDIDAAARSGSFETLDLVIFPNSCDSIKLLSQLWSDGPAMPPAYTLLHPVTAGDEAVRCFADRLRRFAADLQERAGTEITDDTLREAIAVSSQTRRLLRQVYDRRKQTDAFLSGAQTLALVTAGMIMDRREYNQMLEQILQAGQATPTPPDPALKKIMLIGPLMDNIRLLEQIEDTGVSVIDDDITNGSRWIDRDVSTDGDLYRNLAERYLYAAHSPTLYTDPQSDRQAFENRLRTLKPDGVLFIIQKFCEPHLHNYIAKAETLRQLGIPVQMLEIEHSAAEINERQRMQIESLIEVAKK